MHLNKILEQIKRHQSPTEAIDKLATALEKHEGSLLEKGFTILKSELAANMYEAINGPHFDEEHAHYAVEGMENEDGTKGPHWTVEETTSVANQMGINLKSEKHNKNDYKAYERMHRDREEEYGRYARRSGRMEYANKESERYYPYSKYYDEYERPGRNRYYELEYEYGDREKEMRDRDKESRDRRNTSVRYF